MTHDHFGKLFGLYFIPTANYHDFAAAVTISGTYSGTITAIARLKSVNF